jgi:hypothetical protein
MIKQTSHIQSIVSSILTILALFLVGLSACSPGGAAPAADQNDPANGTATALVQNAQSTALLLKAQAMATALVETMNAPQPGAPNQIINTPDAPTATPAASLNPTPQGTPGGVQVVDVTTAADGAYIMVEFRAPVRTVKSWYQGRVSVVDESTNSVYAEIPSVGAIGPLISRPVSDGQLGYVMLVNAPASLKKGALVTVVLGDFRQAHLIVR